jgi:O-antigen/teichoic acid export membrane protein
LVKVYQITENVKKITIFSLILFSINAITKILLIVKFNYGFESLVYAELLTNIASLLLGICYLKYCLGARLSPEYFKESIVYGFPVSIHHLSTWVVSYSSALLVAYSYDEYLLGVFSIAIKVFLPATFVIDAMANAYSPVYYKLRKTGHRAVKEIDQLNNLFINTSLVLCAAMIWGTKLCVYYLFNEQYLVILDFIPIICLSLFFNGLYRIKVAEIFYLKRTSIVPKITVITGFFVLLSGYFLISNFGLMGGGMSMLLSSIFQYLMVSFYTKDVKILSIRVTQWVLMAIIWLTVFAEILAVNTFKVDILVIIVFQFFASVIYLGYFIVPVFFRGKQ